MPNDAAPLARALVDACTAHAARPALTANGLTLSYSELWQQACQLADEIQRLAPPAALTDAPVMVRCSNHPSDFAAFLAVWLVGALVVPVHRTTPAAVVDVIQTKAACALSIDLLAETPLSTLDHDEPRQPLPKDGALIIFTSGSTGQPKGVVLSHRAFLAKLAQNQRLFQAGPDTTTLLVLNNTFSFGIWVALMTLLAGGKVVAVSRFAPQSLVDLLCQEGVSFLGVVPTMARALFAAHPAADLAQVQARLQRTGRLRQIVTGGEPLGQSLSDRLRAFIAPAELYDVYGLTETATCDFVLMPENHATHPGSIGKPFPGIGYRLIESELQLATPYIMAGYCNDAALTEAAFSDDGWFRTGDLATVDDNGFVYLTGRLKELINRGGNKITPLEIEAALLHCAGVVAALATGMPDPVLGQRIHALLVAQPDAVLNATVIRQALAARLEKFKMPDVFYLSDSLPAGSTGKVSRAQLQRWITNGKLTPLPE